MSSTPKFSRCDTKRPDGFYVQFAQVTVPDDDCTLPDQRQDGYWPSQDKDDPGYCGDVTPARFAELYAEAQSRMDAFEAGDWGYVGVRARALCFLVRNNTGTYFNLDSPGIWGVESDAGRYLQELYAEQIDELKDMLAAMQNPVYES